MAYTFLYIFLLSLVARGFGREQDPIKSEGRKNAYNVTLNVSQSLSRAAFSKL
jgi:hypothetical protein